MRELFLKLETVYGIESIVEAYKVVQGVLSENHVLTDFFGKKYFLKKYRDRYSSEHIGYIHRSKQYFHREGIPVILPLEGMGGETLFSFEGANYALFPFVDGLLIRRNDRNRKAIFNAGVMLARIHLAGMKSEIPKWSTLRLVEKVRFVELYDQISAKIEAIEEKSEYDLLAEKLITLKKRLLAEAVSPEVRTDCLIHGDYHGANIFFDDNFQVAHVYDFEKTEYGPRAFELARTLEHMCLASQFDAAAIEHAGTFLAGYQSVFSIDFEELRYGFEVFYKKLLLSLWIPEEHYLKNNLRVDRYLITEYQTLLYLSDNLEDVVQGIYDCARGR